MTHIPGHIEPQPYLPPVGIASARYGGPQPYDPFTAFQNTFGNRSNYISDYTGPWYKHPITQMIPFAGTALHWNDMGPWERGFSVASDVIDVASLGSLKPVTAAIGSIPNPLGVVRRLPGWDKDQYFMRTGRPPGSGIEARGFKPQVSLGELGNFPIPPPAYTDLPIQPTKPWVRGGEPRGISSNWGQPGGYPMEKGVSSYMAKPFDPGDVPVSTGAFDVAEEVPSVYGGSGFSLQHPLTKPSGQTFSAEELANPNLMVLRNPKEYIQSLGPGNFPVTRSPLEHTIGASYGKEFGLGEAKRLQQHWMKQGLPSKLFGPTGKGTYRIEGKAVPELGADLEHLMDYYPTAKQLQRFGAEDIAIASPSYSAQLFGHLDPYGRKLLPGGENPFKFFENMPQLVTAPDQAILIAEAMRAINAYMGDKKKKPSRGNGDTGG